MNRRQHVIAESNINDVRVILPRSMGGYGLDAQWSDDFHHSLHTLLTGEHNGYYQDFGKAEHLARAFRSHNSRVASIENVTEGHSLPHLKMLPN